ncbi:MAG TPA: hypothetical protein VNA69_03000 [Thermoanaerobaculia bacterium]|nr:hypothetical protein [Thermoanaerobaculia bacterium]
MADWVWRQIDSFASLPVFAGFFVLSLIFLLGIFPAFKRHYKDIPTLDVDPWGFSVDDAKTRLDAMNEHQLRVYRMQELTADLIFPLVYSIGFAVATVLLLRYVNAPHWLVLLPFGAAIADYGENLSIAAMIGRKLRGLELGTIASVGSVASRFKHSLLLATIVVLVGLGAWAVWKRYR